MHDYLEMIEIFQKLSSHPQIYVVVPPPNYESKIAQMNQTVINDVLPPLIKRIVQRHNTLGHTKSVQIINVFSQFAKHCPNFTKACAWMQRDGCHPNYHGYGNIARIVHHRLMVESR